jgi:hypothetical protein
MQHLRQCRNRFIRRFSGNGVCNYALGLCLANQPMPLCACRGQGTSSFTKSGRIRYRGSQARAAPSGRSVPCFCVSAFFAGQGGDFDPTSKETPFSFQQLTPTQSPISPLNPIFPPFVGIKMRNSLPSNNITHRPIPREKCKNQVQFPGRATGNWVLWVRIAGKAKASFRRSFSQDRTPKT